MALHYCKLWSMLLGSNVKESILLDAVGSLIGATSGALAGRAAHCGILRGAGIGAVAGAVLTIELLETSRTYWHSDRSGRFSSSYVSGFWEEVSGRLAREIFSPSNPRGWHVDLAEMSYGELYDMLLPAEGRMKGASQEFLGSLPSYVVTQDSRLDVHGHAFCCAICLQELEEGDMARDLPVCKHTFHMKCVDQWLSMHIICPVCRQYVGLKRI
ncbi:hypothetical protein KP509_24G016500 [Ceratopteris richardii]|uniref:RING-type domain-containing protein n=1 Tax=Ceratopteris richardii TaxID=49495 RepID=A0A8T2RSU4_CERRI|nr:hypothetical protein KP509_24G016500 [Ceratopteris richardii]